MSMAKKKFKPVKMMCLKNSENQMACPFCGYTKFNRTMKELVQMADYGDGIKDELIGGMNDSCGYECGKCGKDVSNEELLISVPFEGKK